MKSVQSCAYGHLARTPSENGVTSQTLCQKDLVPLQSLFQYATTSFFFGSIFASWYILVCYLNEMDEIYVTYKNYNLEVLCINYNWYTVF